MAEAAQLPQRLVAYTNSDWNEEPFQFFTGSTSTPDGPFVSAAMGLRLPVQAANAIAFSTTDGTLTLTAPNEVAITVPLATVATLAPELYNFDLVVTYESGDIETMLTGQVMIVPGILGVTWQIIRELVQVQIVRRTPQIQVGAQQTVQIVRAPSGPRGQAAAQDIGWTLKSSLQAGETLTTPPLPHPATYVAIYAHSDSGFAASQTLTVHQKRAGSVIASATLAVGPAAEDWASSITALVGQVADVFLLVLPSPADSQCTDLSVSLGSTP